MISDTIPPKIDTTCVEWVIPVTIRKDGKSVRGYLAENCRGEFFQSKNAIYENYINKNSIIK